MNCTALVGYGCGNPQFPQPVKRGLIMKFFDVQQGSQEWHLLRRGRFTSSSFDRVLTPKTRKLSAQADGLIAEVIGEAMSPWLPEHAESYTSNAMRHGLLTEEEARRF